MAVRQRQKPHSTCRTITTRTIEIDKQQINEEKTRKDWTKLRKNHSEWCMCVWCVRTIASVLLLSIIHSFIPPSRWSLSHLQEAPVESAPPQKARRFSRRRLCYALTAHTGRLSSLYFCELRSYWYSMHSVSQHIAFDLEERQNLPSTLHERNWQRLKGKRKTYNAIYIYIEW